MNVYQLNTENPPFPLTEEEAPKEINEFVLKCLHATKEERFASADKMLAPWDDAMAKAEVSEANRFWKENFGDKKGVVETGDSFAWSPGTERPFVGIKRCPVAGEGEIEPFPAEPIQRAGVTAKVAQGTRAPCVHWG